MHVWSIDGGRELLSFDTFSLQEGADDIAPVAAVAALSFSPDGKHLAAGMDERPFQSKIGKIVLWDLTFFAGRRRPGHVAARTLGNTDASDITLYDVRRGTSRLAIASGFEEGTYDMSFSADGSLLYGIVHSARLMMQSALRRR